MALYQRGRIWYADYYANGERMQESTGTANKREAEKFLALRISEVQRGVFVKPINVTLHKSLVVWINEYFGAVARDGKAFNQMQVYLDNREKVLTSIGIPQRPADTYGENIRRMRERKLTFGEIGMSPDFYAGSL